MAVDVSRPRWRVTIHDVSSSSVIDKGRKLDALATSGAQRHVRRLELVPTRPARAALREPLRLLFVGTLTEPGGAASHFVSLTKAMSSAGHSVSVVATPGCGIWRALEH